MLAMLRKDCYVMSKHMVGIILAWMGMSAMYAWIPGVESNAMFYLMPVMASTIVLNAVSNDQACRWDLFAAVTPLRPWEIVVGKYVFAYGILALLTGLGTLAGWISTLGKGGSNMGTVVVLVSLMTALGLPLVYRFGRHKGATVLLVIWGLAAAAIFGAAHWNYGLIEAAFGWIDAVPVPVMMAGCTVILAVLNICSVFLSIRFYTRRQKGWYD